MYLIYPPSFIVGLMLCASFSFSQNPYHVIYDVNDGLPSDELYDVQVTKDNLIWIATDRGVSTFNGYQFKTYTQKDGYFQAVNFKFILSCPLIITL